MTERWHEVLDRRWLLGLTLLAFALRVSSLGRWELWFDETASYAIAIKTVPDLLVYTRNAIQEHPPGYYLLLHFWMQVAGSSEFALRYVSVFAGVLFVPLIFRLASRLFSRRVGVAAAFVATVSPFAVSYAQEARMYTLIALLALLSLYTFWLMMQEERWRWWIVWASISFVGVLTHYLFGLLIIAQNAYVLLQWRDLGRERWRWLALQAALAAGAVAWILVAPGTVRSLFSLVGVPSRDIGLKIGKVLLDFALGELRGDPSPVAMGLAASLPWALAAGGLAVAARRTAPPPFRAALVLTAVTLFVPFLAGVPVIPVVIGRYFFVAFPAFCIAIALAFTKLADWHWSGLVLALGGLLIVSGYGLFYQYTVEKGVFGAPMTLIQSEYQPDEAMILAHPHLWPQATYYARNIRMPRYYVPDKPYPVPEPEIRAALQDILDRYNSVWFGPVLPAYTDPELVERALNRMAFQSEKVWFPDSTFVAHYFRALPGMEEDDPALNWEGRIALARYEHSDFTLPAGDALRLRFFWQRLAPLQRRYLVSLTLTGPQGAVWAKRASEPCGALCLTTAWGTEEVQDQHALWVPADTPPGAYDLRITWYEQGGGRPLEATDAQGAALGTSVRLATVTVTAPRLPGTSPQPATPTQATFANGLVLRGFNLPNREVRPGDVVPLELFWGTAQQPGRKAELVLSLLTPSGQTLATTTAALAPSYPVTRWPAGRTVRSHLRVAIPPTVRSGQLRLQLRLQETSGKPVPVHWQRPLPVLGGLWGGSRSFHGEALPLATLRVRDRDHVFALPPISNPLSATMGSQVKLAGFDWSCPASKPCVLHPGEELRLTLFWQALGPTERRYKVFTHLVGPDGKLWGQQDREPAGGIAPTTTWVAGEVLSDTYAIPLDSSAPPGNYRLLVGMYDEAGGQRLPASLSGERAPNDALPIAELRVGPTPPENEGR
ncbi:MAG: hypothetical protein GXP41_02770 [Chloroflexi bacterium]|nr:hypothetical protein [Chloroflexota bacterium]